MQRESGGCRAGVGSTCVFIPYELLPSWLRFRKQVSNEFKYPKDIRLKIQVYSIEIKVGFISNHCIPTQIEAMFDTYMQTNPTSRIKQRVQKEFPHTN